MSLQLYHHHFCNLLYIRHKTLSLPWSLPQPTPTVSLITLLIPVQPTLLASIISEYDFYFLPQCPIKLREIPSEQPPFLCCDAHKTLNNQAAGAVWQLPITLTRTVSLISGGLYLPTSSSCFLFSIPISLWTSSFAFQYLPQQGSPL